MALILCLETATEVCSVALFRGDKMAGLKESSEKNVHSSLLTVFIGELFRESGLQPDDLDAVAISMGPGSYTGLRIGVASAKGMCYALGKPLIAIPTLQAMAFGMGCSQAGRSTNGIKVLCPMIDARRMEVYCAMYDDSIRELREARAEIIDENSFRALLDSGTVLFGGDGAGKCKSFLSAHPNALILDDFRASARFMHRFAEEKFNRQEFENLAYFEPFYLKDFIAGKPRVKGLM